MSSPPAQTQSSPIENFLATVLLGFLAFLECGCYTFRIWSSGKKNPYVKYVSSHFLTLSIELHLVCFGLGASFAFGATVHTFVVVIISLHMRKLAMSLHLAWLNSKKFDFTLFILYSHKGWTSALVCDSVYSLLHSGWVYSSVATLLLRKSTRFHDKKNTRLQIRDRFVRLQENWCCT